MNKRTHADRSAICLVVEDEPAILRLVSIVLEDLGCETMAAPNAQAALAVLRDITPDLMIADVKLPGINGVELTKQVKSSESLSTMPVLLMSAYGEPHGHSGDDFLAKPFDIEGLVEIVAPYIDKHSYKRD